MAILNILKEQDPQDNETLRKKSRPVERITPRILTLLDDMHETLVKAEGIGLAAPQVGVLRRIVIVEVGEDKFEMINPEIIEEDGEAVMVEGCLSVPDKIGEVKRPQHIKVKAKNRDGEEFILEATDYFARAICHEVDHLNGVVFVDKADTLADKE